MQIPSVTLNNRAEMPQIGFGTWRIKKEKDCVQAVTTALECGYRHIDTAQIYGNEQYVGRAIKESGLKRSEVFITTKIWNDNLWWDDFDPSLEVSLSKLHTEYVDLLLVHFPVTEVRGPAWHKMEKAYEEGKARAIGVSNYTIKHLQELLGTCKVRPSVNQVELHVFLQQPELVRFCKDNGIIVEAYSPLAHGYGIEEGLLQRIAEKYNKSPAQIMLRWCIEQGTVPLPKSSHPDRIKENLKIFDFKLDENDLEQIENLNRNFRTCWDPTRTP
jgi:diketogulonate reductase-like aldo/keto reductase